MRDICSRLGTCLPVTVGPANAMPAQSTDERAASVPLALARNDRSWGRRYPPRYGWHQAYRRRDETACQNVHGMDEHRGKHRA